VSEPVGLARGLSAPNFERNSDSTLIGRSPPCIVLPYDSEYFQLYPAAESDTITIYLVD
jgi:hypothetical protein